MLFSFFPQGEKNLQSNWRTEAPVSQRIDFLPTNKTSFYCPWNRSVALLQNTHPLKKL